MLSETNTTENENTNVNTSEKSNTNENSRPVPKLMEVNAVSFKEIVPYPGLPFVIESDHRKQTDVLTVAAKTGTYIFIALRETSPKRKGNVESMNKVGALARVRSLLPLEDGRVRAVIHPFCRAFVKKFEFGPFGETIAHVRSKRISSELFDTPETKAMRNVAYKIFKSTPKRAHAITAYTEASLDGCENIEMFTYTIAASMIADCHLRQELIEIDDAKDRLERFLVMLRAIELEMKTQANIEKRITRAFDENQREYYLREKIRVIREELGEPDEYEEYAYKIEKALLPEYVEDKLFCEVQRLEHCSYGSPENALIRNYLDTCLELPWSKSSRAVSDVARARRILNNDHYGLEKVKQRILEYIAVQKLTSEPGAQILCLVGPPGVGKTSVASSIARAMNREFVRISLGGIRDEADIRGHRKTYIGSMPGRISEALSRAGVNNPVILLDEIDKVGEGHNGDPSSALLEVLDPEQNKSFRDHFIELEFDLSKCIFIATANTTDTIQRALLDRMEIIEMSTYTRHEKFEIAKRHLIPKQLKRHGIDKRKLSITDDALFEIIDYYSTESGVRNLERHMAALCRKAALKFDEGFKGKLKINDTDIKEYLGNRLANPEKVSPNDEIGVVNGLAYTQVGGDLLKIEALVMEGSGKLELTGSLGYVMKESAHTALSYVRSRANALGIDPNFAKNSDIHIHVPDGAVPKDGPSAGITLATALASALSKRPVRRDIAMTGELTLTGKVIPIGGLKEKTLAAYSAGIKTVIIPQENLANLDDIDPIVKSFVNFIPVSSVDKVFEMVLV